MARPTTKGQLIQTSEEKFSKLFILINSMTEKEREATFSFEDRDRNIRDVLIHLFEWHNLLLNWVRTNQSGTPINFLPTPYNWKTYPQMNIGFWEKHQTTSLKDAIIFINQSHSDIMELISSFPDEELFTKKYFPWTGTTSLGSYCVSSASSHYEWAIKKINKHKKSLLES